MAGRASCLARFLLRYSAMYGLNSFSVMSSGRFTLAPHNSEPILSHIILMCKCLNCDCGLDVHEFAGLEQSGAEIVSQDGVFHIPLDRGAAGSNLSGSIDDPVKLGVN